MSETVDNREKAIMGFIAKNPGASVYGIYEGLKKTKKVEIGNRIFVLRRISMLTSRGFLHAEKGPRNANPSWLTIKGLIYAVQQGAIEPKDAPDIQEKHKIKIPCTISCQEEKDKRDTCRYVEKFKSKHPEVFFKVLSCLPRILESPEDRMNEYCCLASILGACYLYYTDPGFYEECQRTKNFDAGCLGMADPGPPYYPEKTIFSIARPMFTILGFEMPKTPPYDVSTE